MMMGPTPGRVGVQGWLYPPPPTPYPQGCGVHHKVVGTATCSVVHPQNDGPLSLFRE